MKPNPFDKLARWILEEYKNHNSVFGIEKSHFFRKEGEPLFDCLGERLDTLVGPAAGPHTQLAQNIVSAYLTGGRFFELKTVQIIDELNIERPCIDAEDEGYNIEWSQELKLEQSFDEYLKAWLLVHFAKEYFDLSDNPARGFIFNMSVGYDLNGIKSPRMDQFINSLTGVEVRQSFFEYKNRLLELTEKWGGKERNQLLNSIQKITPAISNSVTLSTMHGCPPEEIESIAKYLIGEKGLHTFVKLNPTLLGFNSVKEILTALGCNANLLKPDSFEKDLRWKDAVGIIARLKEFARQNGKEFGVKLSNTLAVKNLKRKMPGDEIYLSGRFLFPVTINLAARLAEYFNGELNISFSGGASVENVFDLLECGIYPVTFATELLKPGGYIRQKQIAEKSLAAGKAIRKNGIDLRKIKFLSFDALNNPLYRKESRCVASLKLDSKLEEYDCYVSPCASACPIHQDVAEYISLLNRGKFADALEVIYLKNPLPHITGYICDRKCVTKCVRWDYENHLAIREIKREAAEKGYAAFVERIGKTRTALKSRANVAIIGAGPSGLAAAYFLAKAGLSATVFDKEKYAGGIVRNVIPNFRLPQAAIEKDINLIKMLGVKFELGRKNISIKELKEEGYKYFYIAIGAGKSNILQLGNSDCRIIEAFEFLKNYRAGIKQDLGKHVAVIGGGNSAMDSARAAIRCAHVEKVYIIYRRTSELMPADREEFYAALEDGVDFKELLAPVSFANGVLKCAKMKLGKIGIDGRKLPVPVEDKFEEFYVDTIISAIGERVDERFLASNRIPVDENGKPIADSMTGETLLGNVFIGGDALRGPSTVVEAIADGTKAAKGILAKEGISLGTKEIESFLDSSYRIKISSERKGIKKYRRSDDYTIESERCLHCNILCNKCAEVCPNRANVAIAINDPVYFKDKFQILHIDSLCNECGNCATFCPHTGKPYKDKTTLFDSEESFRQSSNNGFLIQSCADPIKARVRINGAVGELAIASDGKILYNSLDATGSSIRMVKLIVEIFKHHNYML